MGRYVNFNQVAYIKALELALTKAMNKVSKEVMTALLTNFGALNVRELDRKHLAAMKRSVRYASTRTANSIMSQFLAGFEGQPNQSFRVLYYEYGTGSEMKPPKGYTPMDDPYWNPARPRGVGESIWTRPKGSWKDAGGNWHTSRTRGRPRPLSSRSRRGTPVQAQRWFRRAFEQGTTNLDKYVLDAVKSVSISSYISIADIYKRM